MLGRFLSPFDWKKEKLFAWNCSACDNEQTKKNPNYIPFNHYLYKKDF